MNLNDGELNVKFETSLEDRMLRFDGVSVVHPDEIARFIYLGISPNKIQTIIVDDSVHQFNKQVDAEDAIIAYDVEAPVLFDLAWQLPKKYLQLDLEEYIVEIFEKRLAALNYSDSEVEIASARISYELDQIFKRNMVEFIQTVIYIIDTLREKKQVWGVGRGSSCASYILFLIGLHVVDCVRLDVDANEFFHD